jgi:heme oxygenase (biliverdin-IX-beta and delta-forming)
MPLTAKHTHLSGLVKNETQKVHEEVEAILLPALTSIRTTDDYAIILKMFYGYFQPIEKSIEQFLHTGILPDLAERRKASSLLEDLRQLGHATDNLPLCTELPSINDSATAFGALYVLEGSTLGGKHIAKMLAKNAAVPEGATRFFSGYGEQTGSRWKAFLEVFNRQPGGEAVIASANQTFYLLKGWMQQAL